MVTEVYNRNKDLVDDIFNENEDGAPVVSGVSTSHHRTILFHHQVQQHRDHQILVRE